MGLNLKDIIYVLIWSRNHIFMHCSWVKSLHMDNMIVESNCLVVVTVLLVSYVNYSKFGSLVYGCLMLKSSFKSLSFYWTCRRCYETTHSLSRVTLLHGNCTEWDVPTILSVYVLLPSNFVERKTHLLRPLLATLG